MSLCFHFQCGFPPASAALPWMRPRFGRSGQRFEGPLPLSRPPRPTTLRSSFPGCLFFPAGPGAPTTLNVRSRHRLHGHCNITPANIGMDPTFSATMEAKAWRWYQFLDRLSNLQSRPNRSFLDMISTTDTQNTAGDIHLLTQLNLPPDPLAVRLTQSNSGPSGPVSTLRGSF